MIFLHLDEDARTRIDKLAEESGGSVLAIDLNVAQGVDTNVINKWLSDVSDPKLIVIFNAHATNRDQRRSFEAMRRIAKFRGIDVHMMGDRTVCRNNRVFYSSQMGISVYGNRNHVKTGITVQQGRSRATTSESSSSSTARRVLLYCAQERRYSSTTSQPGE